MKKILALSIVLCLFASMSFAEEVPEIYVSISDETGKLVLAYEPFALTDADQDGVLTISDALLIAHREKHENGAEAYEAYLSDFGLSLGLLWGIDNGGSYGYYLNHTSPLSLADPIQAGDHVKAYAFTDLDTWSDTYCYFDVDSLRAAPGNITLTLFSAGYDAAWNPVTLPVADAVITVNEEMTEYKTDAEGKVVLSFSEAGKYVISAASETQTLVPPVCILTVDEAQ